MAFHKTIKPPSDKVTIHEPNIGEQQLETSCYNQCKLHITLYIYIYNT